MIGCDCAVCHSTDPRDDRLRSSVYVQTPECSFVVDTGTDFRTQALRENIRAVDAVVFTHSHTDHIMGFDDLRRFAYERGSMPVYAAPETMTDLERVFEFAFKALESFSRLSETGTAHRDRAIFSGRNRDHAFAGAAWKFDREWLPVFPAAAENLSRI